FDNHYSTTHAVRDAGTGYTLTSYPGPAGRHVRGSPYAASIPWATGRRQSVEPDRRTENQVTADPAGRKSAVGYPAQRHVNDAGTEDGQGKRDPPDRWTKDQGDPYGGAVAEVGRPAENE